MSPSSPEIGTPESVFGKFSRLDAMIGTKDIAVGNGHEISFGSFSCIATRRKIRVGAFWCRISAFTERALPGDNEPRIKSPPCYLLSTAFWDVYLMGNTSARNELDGDGPKSILDKQDTWQRQMTLLAFRT